MMDAWHFLGPDRRLPARTQIMWPVRLIGIGNRARQGKDLLADWLVKADARGTGLRIAMSDAILVMAQALGAVAPGERNPPFFQALGSAFRDHVRDTWWIEAATTRINEVTGAGDLVVVTGVRYKNEIEWIKQNKGLTVQVTRWHADGTRWLATDRPADHPSEVEGDDPALWDMTIKTTDGDLDCFREHARSVLRTLWGKNIHENS